MRKHVVLVAEDECSLARSWCARLRRQPWVERVEQLPEAARVEIAIDAAEATGTPWLAVLDIMMPGEPVAGELAFTQARLADAGHDKEFLRFTGYLLLHRLAERHAALAHVLVVTGVGFLRLEDTFRHLGVPYRLKPISAADLVAAVNAVRLGLGSAHD